MSDLIERLQKMSACIYLVTEESVANDIADGLRKAMERLKELEAENARLLVDADAKQAQIDSMMLEYCPESMTLEQIQKWKDSQRKTRNGFDAAKESP